MKFVVQFLLTLGIALQVVAQSSSPASGKKLDWKTVRNGAEFSVSMPEGSIGATDDTDASYNNFDIKKRVFVSRNLGHTFLSVDMYTGRVKGLRNDFASRITRKDGLKFVRGEEREIDGVSIQSFEKTMGLRKSIIQLLLSKKALYIVSAHSVGEKDDLVQHFVRSVQMSSGANAVFPNRGADQGSGLATLAPTIYDESNTEIKTADADTKPSSLAILFLFQPRFQTENGSGTVTVKARFAATGRIENAEFVSGERSLLAGAVDAVQRIIFIPAEKDGRFVSTTKQMQYSRSIY